MKKFFLSLILFTMVLGIGGFVLKANASSYAVPQGSVHSDECGGDDFNPKTSRIECNP